MHLSLPASRKAAACLAACATAALTLAAAPAHAAPAARVAPAHGGSDATTQRLARLISTMSRAHAGQAEIDAAVKAQLGGVRVDRAGTAPSARAAYTTIHGNTVSNPTIYKFGSDWYASFGWRWINNLSDVADGTHWDSVALSFDQQIRRLGFADCHWGDAFPTDCSIDNLLPTANGGMGMVFKNRVSGSDGSGKYGTGVIRFRSTEGCKTYTADGAFAHAPLETGIDSWTVGPGFLQANFSGSSKGWTNAAGTATANVC
ncbi:hypothetical protein [Actinomadura decatromicini]|uniref:Uncharacterized protein n=1 Tax=Actinomadura decatromicini TaxID=2604572 RepID=A0A5D3F2Q0_9ACTN|nr:hypothetical protein [Actinomadura decatromicini]TYK43277.1 hypothetical protein FXF68_39370 [Actinomadura decatromicini]